MSVFGTAIVFVILVVSNSKVCLHLNNVSNNLYYKFNATQRIAARQIALCIIANNGLF